MNIDQVMPSNSKYVKAEDLKGRDIPVVIGNVSVEKMEDGQTKPVVYFQGKEKGLVLNMTNKNMIKDLYGVETNGWIGKPVMLVTIWTDFQGRQVQAIRVRPPANGMEPGGHYDHQAPPEQRQAQPVQEHYDQGPPVYDDHAPMDDQIPF